MNILAAWQWVALMPTSLHPREQSLCCSPGRSPDPESLAQGGVQERDPDEAGPARLVLLQRPFGTAPM